MLTWWRWRCCLTEVQSICIVKKKDKWHNLSLQKYSSVSESVSTPGILVSLFGLTKWFILPSTANWCSCNGKPCCVNSALLKVQELQQFEEPVLHVNNTWGKRHRLAWASVVTHLYITDCKNFTEAVMILLSFPCYEEVFGSGPSLELNKETCCTMRLYFP